MQWLVLYRSRAMIHQLVECWTGLEGYIPTGNVKTWIGLDLSICSLVPVTAGCPSMSVIQPDLGAQGNETWVFFVFFFRLTGSLGYIFSDLPVLLQLELLPVALPRYLYSELAFFQYIIKRTFLSNIGLQSFPERRILGGCLSENNAYLGTYIRELIGQKSTHLPPKRRQKLLQQIF